MRRPSVPLVSLLLGLFLAGCAASPPAEPPLLRIVTDAAFPPFHYVDADGNVTGHDVELARLAATRAGYRPVVHRAPDFATLFAGLEEDRYDLVAATSGITPERRERFLFSRPYFTTCQAALVRAGASEPRSLADLVGRRVGAAPATTGERAARLIGSGDVVPYSTNRLAIPALERGGIDAYIADEFEVVEIARANPRLRVLPEPAAIERYGFVMRRGQTDLKRRIDAALRSLEADGTMDELRARHALRRDPDWPVDIRSKAPR